MSTKKKDGFLGATVWYLIGTMLNSGLAMLTLPLFSRMLSVDDYGAVSIYTIWINIFAYIIPLNAHASIPNAYIEIGESKLDQYISSIIALSALSFSGFIVVGLLFGETLSTLLLLKTDFLFVMFAQSYATFSITCLQQKYRMQHNAKAFVGLAFANSIICTASALICVLAVPESERLNARIFGFAIPCIAIGSAALAYQIFKGRTISISYWRYCIPIAVPLIIHSLSNSILSHSDKYLLFITRGNTDVGIYGFSYTISSMVSLLWTSCNSEWGVFYYTSTARGQQASIKKAFNLYTFAFTIAIAIYQMILPEFSLLMGSAKYKDSIYLTPLLVLSNYFSFSYSFAVLHEFYHKKTKIIAAATLLSCVINIALNIVFVQLLGRIGVAIGTLIAHLILFAVHDIFVKIKLSDYILDRKRLYAFGAFMLIWTALFYVVAPFTMIRWMVVATLVVLLISYMLNYLKQVKLSGDSK